MDHCVGEISHRQESSAICDGVFNFAPELDDLQTILLKSNNNKVWEDNRILFDKIRDKNSSTLIILNLIKRKVQIFVKINIIK